MPHHVYRSGSPIPVAAHDVCPACGRASDEAKLMIYTSNRKMKVVPIATLTALLSKDKYVELWGDKGLAGLTGMSIVDLLREYPKDFVRVHRNAAVRLNAITGSTAALNETGIRLFVEGCPEEIKVSRREVANFTSAMARTFTCERQQKRQPHGLCSTEGRDPRGD
jgi:DNA-binding LytR/AlgR family response regulator